MSGCAVCEPQPTVLPERCWLYLWPSTPHTGPKVAKLLAAFGASPETAAPDCIRFDLATAVLEQLANVLANALAPQEKTDSKALIMETGGVPGLADFPRVQTLDGFIAAQQTRWLTDLLTEGRLETHFQPIVAVSEPTLPFAYECLLRGRTRGGDLISPGQLFGAAKQAGLLFPLDLAARRKAVQSIADHRLATYALINFTPTSIYDPNTCLRSTVTAVQRLGLEPSRIIFEIIETEQVDERLLKSILDVYRGAGFRVAIDDYGAGYSSARLIGALRPDFLKLDMELIRGIDADPYKAELASGLLETARNLDIRTIAEGIETAAEWEWVRKSGADYAQGYYFARPGSPPPAVQAPTG